MPQAPRTSPLEPPTLALILMTYGLWVWAIWSAPLIVAIPLLGVVLALHASLTHEVLHGHPTPWAWVNTGLIRPGVGLVVPYGRFRDTHLDHHRDENLTDPYDDPESNFLHPADWHRLSAARQVLLQINNTLLGRIVLGPFLGTFSFIAADLRLIRAGNRGVARSWLAHIVWTLPIVALILVAGFPIWAYLLACYFSQALLRVRTFLEHRAHLAPRGRTVVVEDQGPLAFLFLNNNFHVVHHMHPGVAWYRLPAMYFANSAHYLRRNDGYRYASYAEVFRTYLLRAKDPVAHPLRPGATEGFAPQPLDLAEPLRAGLPLIQPHDKSPLV